MSSAETSSTVDVSVIIVTHNSRSVLEPCLESLKRQSIFERSEVIVVDNASSDGTPEYIRDRYPWIELFGNTYNAGFSVGVNLGMQKASGRHFLILNPDTIVREDAIRSLYDFMERTPDAGVAAPKLVYGDGNLQHSCRRFYNWKVLLLRRTPLGKIFKNSRAVSDHLMMEFDHESTERVDWVLGACMLATRSAQRKAMTFTTSRYFLKR